MQTLLKFKNFVDEINKENGRLYKQSVLENYKDDGDIKYFLEQIFNPYIVFGIGKKKLSKKYITDTYLSGLYSMGLPAGQLLKFVGNSNKTVKDLLTYINKCRTGSDQVIKDINAFKGDILHHDTALCEFLDAIITKELSIGVDAKTINKVMPGLIPEFNVQLAEKYFEDTERLEGKDFAITTKIDGGRIIALKENGKVTFYTRQGQVYEGLVDLEEEMKRCLPDNICLDGEITLLEPGKLASKDQYKQTMKITRADGEKHGVKMLVFDRMTAEEFRQQCCKDAYVIRRGELLSDFSHFYFEECAERGNNFDKENLPTYPHYPADSDEYEKHVQVWRDDQIAFLNTKYKYFEILPWLYCGNDTKMIKKILDEQVANGEEGIMLNVLGASYDFKRTWNLQKVKKMQTLDLEVVDYFEGDKSFTGMLGGFIVRYKDGNTVRVGSGFNKDFRIEAWKDPAQYIGKIIEVQYFEETTNQNGGISLRFPVFVDFRTDKIIPDF